MNYIFIFFLFFTFVASCKRTSYGIGLLLLSRILIPEVVRIRVQGCDISLNTAVILIISLFVLKDVVCKNVGLLIRETYIKKLLIYILVFFIILILSDYKDFNYQISHLIQFSVTDILPAILCVLAVKTKKDLNIIIKFLYWCSLISCLYGIFTIFINANPYVGWLNFMYGSNDNISSFDITNALSDDRGFASTSGTFVSANAWGYFLPIVFVFIYFVNQIDYKKKNVVLLVLLSICVLLSSKRTALVAYLTFWLFYFLFSSSKRKLQIIVGFFVLAVIALCCLYFIPELEKAKGLIMSSICFWDDNLAARTANGSNFQMRINQMTYCFFEVRNNFLFGHGFDWTGYYLQNHAYHPIMFGFENIVSSAVCNGGLIGLFLWIYIFITSYKYSCGKDKNKLYYRLFTITQLAIAIGSGLSYFVFYGIFVVLLKNLKFLRYSVNEKL